MRIPIACLIVVCAHATVTNYEDAVRLQKQVDIGQCPSVAQSTDLHDAVSAGADMTFDNSSFWHQLQTMNKSLEAMGASSSRQQDKQSLYEAVLSVTGVQEHSDRSGASALVQAVAEAQAATAATKAESSCAASAEAEASASASAEARVAAAQAEASEARAEASSASERTAALQQEIKSMNTRSAQEMTSVQSWSSVSFERVADMWKRYSSSVRRAWSTAMHMSESEEWTALASMVTSGSSYSASSATYAELTASWSSAASSFMAMSASTQAAHLESYGVLGGMALFGALVVVAQQAAGFLQDQCSAGIGRRATASKDIFVRVAEALTTADMETRLAAVLDNRCFKHAGQEWRVDARTGELRLAADYTASGVAAALVDGEKQPGMRSRIELGQLIDALYDQYYGRCVRTAELARFDGALQQWAVAGALAEAEGAAKPRLGARGLGMSVEQPCGVFRAWADAREPALGFDDKRGELELLWSGGFLSADEHAWLERLVGAYERWDVDLADEQDPADKLVALVASIPITPRDSMPVCPGLN